MGKWKADLKVREKGNSVAVQWLGLCFHCQGSKFNPWLGSGGTKILQANQHSSLPSPQKKENIKQKTQKKLASALEKTLRSLTISIRSPSPGRFFPPIPLLDLYQINLSPYYCSKLLSQNSLPTYLLCRKGYHSTLHTPPSLIFISLNFNPLSEAHFRCFKFI